MTVTDTGWLREQRLARGWTIAEMGRQLQHAAKDTGDHTVPGTAILASYVRRWEAGKIGLTERYRLHYCTALGIPPGHFPPAAHHVPALAEAREHTSVTVWVTAVQPCPHCGGQITVMTATLIAGTAPGPSNGHRAADGHTGDPAALDTH